VRLGDASVQRGDPGEVRALHDFARCAGLGLASLSLEDLAESNLCLLFALSAWLHMADAGIGEACSSLLALRRALLEAVDLDTLQEPVPLLAGEPGTALSGLAIYLRGLMSRAAHQAGMPPEEVVEEALALL
jgi:hypothetical protein